MFNVKYNIKSYMLWVPNFSYLCLPQYDLFPIKQNLFSYDCDEYIIILDVLKISQLSSASCGNENHTHKGNTQYVIFLPKY
jgi:hypothetical protein